MTTNNLLSRYTL